MSPPKGKHCSRVPAVHAEDREFLSGAKEDGFALKHFDSDEECGGGIKTSGEKDESYESPMVGAGDKFFAEQAHVENGNDGEFRSELNARQHGCNGRDDNDESHGSEIALGFFVGFGKERDGHKHGGEENGNGQGHYEDGEDRAKTDVELDEG